MPCSNCKEKGHNIRSCMNKTGTFKDCENDLFNYKGQMKNGKPHGHGKGEWIGDTEGYTYIGVWKDGKRHGKGIDKNITFESEEEVEMETYEGNWENDKRHGCGIYKEIKDGECIYKYEGDWLNHKYSGYGIMSKKDYLRYSYFNESDSDDSDSEDKIKKSIIYKGNWFDGKRSGHGIEIDEDGTKYEGMWKNDLPDGYGVTIHSTGDKHEGYYKEGETNGKGIYYFNSGDRYEGNFLNYNMSGEGIMYEREGSRLEGTWKNDLPCGFGTRFDTEGNKEYEGYVNDYGEIHGHGKWFINGKTYEGEFVHGVMNGLFKITYKDDSTSELFIENGNVNVSRKMKCKKIEKLATDDCPICHEKIKSNITITQCNHTFHSTCLFKWLVNKNSCPMCREILIE